MRSVLARWMPAALSIALLMCGVVRAQNRAGAEDAGSQAGSLGDLAKRQQPVPDGSLRWKRRVVFQPWARTLYSERRPATEKGDPPSGACPAACRA